MSPYDSAERDSVGLGRAMLALFISSIIVFATQLGLYAIGATPHSLGGGLLYFVALVVGEAFLLRWCLTWFGWTISIKAAVVARVLAGIAGVMAVLMVSAAAPLRNAAVGFLVMFVVQYVVAGWIVVLAADPLDESYRDERPTGAWSPAPAIQDDSKLYTAEDFLADSKRVQLSKQRAT
jgi:hypothetical protein